MFRNVSGLVPRMALEPLTKEHIFRDLVMLCSGRSKSFRIDPAVIAASIKQSCLFRYLEAFDLASGAACICKKCPTQD